MGVIRGRVWDVAVDIRPGSPTFGKYHAVELSGDNGVLLWIPAGFAHGFCVLGDEPADMLYKVTALYNPAGEGGIRYDDPELNIPWPLTNPLVSERDLNLPSWRDYCSHPPTWEPHDAALQRYHGQLSYRAGCCFRRSKACSASSSWPN